MYDYYGDYSYYGDEISFMDILSGISDALDKVIILMNLVMLVAGIIQCFWGYKLYRFTIVVSGFVTGLTIGAVSGIAMAIKSDGVSLSDIITFTLGCLYVV